ncbi:DUF4303 domain-containing protein [Elizabethkingia anophelis]|uniref:DUF4303 domain-containing protein n=1 Tax=Elizabethkingia anophelis R26 TaxID=1246994 RepID=A0ABN5BMM0_9FLAO|nr:DUF4303 domain-containing protein [Elizabethkingia anophelis]ATC34974.1 DUF4303 domain-containing protein [Elizabethkingia anophelis R26]ATC38615.1 DUF4303 domain-containing protein [Elizabethkingia anophelis Ag1]ATC42295.1 DUF4303 domain-containing protein [Elizabethkingia anophelis]ATC45971.1 DUF4303 domain-containing protein [Elizabethkingia anophelis]ELR78373.1 hypothetical protein D505_13822 [Elizabethkingia anophelis R26]
MSKSNSKIKLSEEEALKIIVDLDQIVVSLDKIKSHFAEDSDFQKHDKTLSDYIINEKVNQTLAQIRGLISSKFSLSVGEDDMDDLERACSTNRYWTPENNEMDAVSVNPKNWHERNLPVLSSLIVNEFVFFHQLFSKKEQNMYAFALILDDDCLTAYSAVSTTESLKKIHKNKEWDAPEWCFCVSQGAVKEGVDTFTRQLLDRYRKDIVPLFQQGFDYAPERQKNLQLFTDAMRIAKQELVKKYGNVVEEMAFYISIPGEPIVEKNTALAINSEGNTKVKELLDSLYI